MDLYLLEPIINVYLLGSFTILFGHILDFTIDKENLIIYMQKKTDLYIQGLRSLYMNLLFISGFNYIIAYNYLLDIQTNNLQILKYSGILLTHNIMYFGMHSMVHKINAVRFIHNFHHLFIQNIPSIGNAVSFLEFQIMYVLPFLYGMYLFQPNVTTINCSILTISILNSIIHSSALEKMNWLPFLVSPKKHGNHHKNYTSNYAAPLIDIDALAFPSSTTGNT